MKNDPNSSKLELLLSNSMEAIDDGFSERVDAQLQKRFLTREKLISATIFCWTIVVMVLSNPAALLSSLQGLTQKLAKLLHLDSPWSFPFEYIPVANWNLLIVFGLLTAIMAVLSLVEQN